MHARVSDIEMPDYLNQDWSLKFPGVGFSFPEHQHAERRGCFTSSISE